MCTDMTYCLTQAQNYDYHHTLPHYPTLLHFT